MVEIQVSSTELLPENYQWMQDLKNESQVFAKRLESVGLRKYADRVKGCADILTFKQFKNGHLVFKKTQFCRVNGCPFCQTRKVKHYMGGIHHWLDENELDILGIIVLKIKGKDVDSVLQRVNYTAARFGSRNGRGNILNRGTHGYVLVNSVCIEEGEIVCYCYFLLNSLQRFWEGKSRVAKKELPALLKLNAGDEVVLHERINGLSKKDLIEFFRFYFSRSGCDYSSCPDNTLSLSFPDSSLRDLYLASIKRQMVRGSGCFRGMLHKKPEKVEEEKPYYPSEIKAINAITNEFYGYVSNPKKRKHKNKYLHLPEFNWESS